MKLIKVEACNYVFRLEKREKRLLIGILLLYPLVPLSHHKVSRSGTDEDGAGKQDLLREALEAHRRETRQQLDMLLASHHRLIPDNTGFRLMLDRQQVESLLQILNDVRLGSWIQLGCPDPEKEDPKKPLDAERVNRVVVMELAARFQQDLIDALESGA